MANSLAVEQTVGIDVSKSTLDVFIPIKERWLSLPNSAEGVEELASQIPKAIKKVVIEATGGGGAMRSDRTVQAWIFSLCRQST